MKGQVMKGWQIYLLAVVLAVGAVVMFGCKKEAPAAPASANGDGSVTQIEQKLCPVMGNPINPEVYTEYKGKRVYFCCPECKPKFEAEPEKYVSKLPQFSEESVN
jgi:YHS domain-containing protein